MQVIDLRSDTVTQPTPEMREAMARAEVGDDQSGEDPTVNKLEELAATRLGKEAAMFVPSGMMGNLSALLTYCSRGDEVIMGDQCHIYWYESGSGAALGGLLYRPVPNGRFGELDPEDVSAAIRPERNGAQPTGLVCLENTHNRCGGTVLTPQQISAVAETAHARGVPVHMDGARIFNASVYLGVPAQDLAASVDSVQFCLSKGLSAPVGSVLTGTSDFIARARKVRKMLGGAMRQAGVIAAAGIVALETMVDRLAEDHENARLLAEGIADLPGIEVDLDTVQTDIVVFELIDPNWQPDEFVKALAAEGLRISSFGGRKLRMVAHHGITSGQYREALEVFGRVLTGKSVAVAG